jgi:hypothetical protein
MDLSKPEVWSTLIALFAVILSQLPPIWDMLKGVRVRLVVPESFWLWHYLGNLQLGGFLDIRNDGGRAVIISKLDFIIVDSSGKRWNLPAQTYLSRQPSPMPDQPTPEFLLSWISLKPGEHWGETIHCFRQWSESEEEETNQVVSAIRRDIGAKIAARSAAGGALTEPVEADQGLVERARALAERRLGQVRALLDNRMGEALEVGLTAGAVRSV